MLCRLFLLSLIAVFSIHAEPSVTITPVANCPDAICITPEKPIDGITRFIVMRPYVDSQIYTIRTPIQWKQMAKYAGGALCIGLMAMILTKHSRKSVVNLINKYGDGSGRYYSQYYSRWSESSWKNQIARKMAQGLHEFNYCRGAGISTYLAVGIPAAAYCTYKALKTVASSYMTKLCDIWSRYQASLSIQQVQSLPTWLRQVAQEHFECAPEHLIWYVAEALPPIAQNRQLNLLSHEL